MPEPQKPALTVELRRTRVILTLSCVDPDEAIEVFDGVLAMARRAGVVEVVVMEEGEGR